MGEFILSIREALGSISRILKTARERERERERIHNLPPHHLMLPIVQCASLNHTEQDMFDHRLRM